MKQDQQIQDLEPKVRLIAKKIWYRRPRMFELEDAVQEGMLALVQASQRFDPSRGILLWTFAEHRVTGAILDLYRRSDHCLKMYEELTVGSVDCADPLPTIQQIHDSVECFQLLQGLSDREQYVLRRRFLDEARTVTIGAELKVHSSRVSQISQIALQKICIAA